MLKMRWGILRSASFYLIDVQTGLIIACFLLHNYIRSQMVVDPVEAELGNEADIDDETDNEPLMCGDNISSVEPSALWTKKKRIILQVQCGATEIMAKLELCKPLGYVLFSMDIFIFSLLDQLCSFKLLIKVVFFLIEDD